MGAKRSLALEVTIIGCGTPTPLPDRFGSSYVVQVGDEKLLFDCGPATTWKLARAGISTTEIDNVFFTHHHFDHDADFPTFILTRQFFLDIKKLLCVEIVAVSNSGTS